MLVNIAMKRSIFLFVFVTTLEFTLSDEASSYASTSTGSSAGTASSSSSGVASSSSSGTASSSSSATTNDNNCNPGVKCGKNQVYDTCPSSCPPRTCATKDIAFRCKEPLCPGDPKCPKPICRCADNFYSNDKGECVPKDKCPTKPKCGNNQVYDLCPPSCPPRTCDTKDIAFKCKEPPKPGDPDCPPPACRCADGYYKNDQGECVPKEKCPTKNCGLNEVYVYCPVPTCEKQTCENIDKKFNCPNIPANYPCESECRCKDGYYRNKIGECISKEDCQKCPGKYEYFSCGGACDNECKNLSQQNQTNCPIVNVKCNPMCYCLKDYARDPVTNECIPISKCPPECKKNEIYSNCPNKECRAKTCKDLGFPLPCYQLDGKNSDCGKPGCICEPGFVRNKDGKCIPERECPSCGGDPNAWSGCGVNCVTCDNYKVKNPICPLFCKLNGCDCRPGFVYDNTTNKCVRPEDCQKKCGPHEVPSKCANDPCIKRCATKDLNVLCQGNPADCKPGCVCEKGYLRNDNGVCIPINECPPQCKKNEEYSKCPNKECRPLKCDELGFPLACDQYPRNNTSCGEPACICSPGYVRNKNGACIDPKDCPSCGGDPNAEPGCGNFCITCSNYNDTGRGCSQACLLNGCECRPNYIYDSEVTKKCVLPKECPPKCGLNEVPSNCGNNPCVSTCDEPEKITYCDYNPAICKPGCVCADGYLRNQDGACVPKNKCPPKVICGANEEYVSCPVPTCANQTCENIGKKFGCPAIPSNYPCKGECRCKKGYYRNKIEQCISEEDCKKCQGGNEYFSCGGACDNECKNLSQQNQTNCPIINIVCNPMCYCFKDYARDPVTNKCIPISKCPPECKKNEIYSNCPNKECRAKTCKDLGFPLPCSQLDAKNSDCGKPGCICEPGFVRDKDGKCIPERECPSCGGDPNAWSGCGVFCDTCENYKDKNRGCPLYCKFNSCDCRNGYVYDGTTKKCVLPEQCPPKCGLNEVPSDCANSPCIRNCATKDLNLACKPYLPGCKPGCVCADGYLRDDNNVCVPINKCPSKKCPCNEEYVQCPGKGRCPKTCDEVGFPLACDQPGNNTVCGNPDCVCKSGYVRNKNGVCIDANECPSCGGDPNAQPGCGTFCIRCDNYKDKGRACPASCILNGCDCRPKYVYDSKSKKCVLPKDCPCN